MKNIFYDKSKIDYGNLLFPRRALWMLLIPLIIEQMLNSLMGMVDTLILTKEIPLLSVTFSRQFIIPPFAVTC